MESVPTVIPIPMASTTSPKIRNIMDRVRANSGPTLETFLQCGHLARALFSVLKRKVSWQWAHVTLHIPGTLGTGTGAGGDGARLMIRLQLGLGQAILWLLLLHIRRQLHGHLTYFLPGGAFRIGVASLQELHFTTCWSFFPDISIMLLHTLQLTMGTPPANVLYGGGSSSGPIGDTVVVVLELPTPFSSTGLAELLLPRRGCLSTSSVMTNDYALMYSKRMSDL